MTSTDAIRRAIVNQGAFFSPYYLFDVLGRQHAEELDPLGREANRRLLRQNYHKAIARFRETGSKPGEAWQAWYEELFTALGFDSTRLRRLDAPVDAGRFGLVPISHVAAPSADAPPLVFIDLHGFGVDLDRQRYPQAGRVVNHSHVTIEPVARAIEFVLDQNEARWAIVAAGERLRLYRKGGSVARQYLEVAFTPLFDGDRTDEWTAFWGLFRYDAFVPDPASGKCLLDRVLEESQRHAARIADDLRENIVLAVEALVQGVLDEPANKGLFDPTSPQALQQIFEETLYFLYRLLFVLYAESRDMLPLGESPVYRDTYSLEHLRAMAEQPLHPDDDHKTYYSESLRTLFTLLRAGFPTTDRPLAASPFRIPAFNGQLFDLARTALLDRCRIGDRAMREVIREISLSRPRRRNDRRERYSYADLGVDQLGSIYEGLLVFEPMIVAEEMVVAKVKGEERLLARAHAEEHGLAIIEGSARKPGSFVLRVWGGRRKGSGSYYTPQEITAFLVKEALEPLVEPIVQGCAERDGRDRPHRSPDEILELKVCDPAMGSAAFLVQACRYLAEAYGRARIAAGIDDDGRISQEELARYKRRVAEKCLYGVDLNPMAVELAKVSLWLETLSGDRPLTFLDAHLRCGNALIGAPLRDGAGALSIAGILSIPDAALEEVSKEATKAQKAAARERIKRNREQIKSLARQRAGQLRLPDEDAFDLAAFERALADTLERRRELEISDEDKSAADAVQLVHAKQRMFDSLEHGASSRYRRAKLVLDLWCAVWFWPEPGIPLSDEDETPEPPTTTQYLDLTARILTADEAQLEALGREPLLSTARRVAAERRFFHWELELPEVFGGERGGFDALVANPPWETVKPNSQEFWSNHNPLFRELGKQAALRYADDLRADEAIDGAWRSYERGEMQQGSFFKEGPVYRDQGKGDTNTYKLFLERNLGMLREGGGLGIVMPSGLYTDLGAKELRERLFATSRVRYLLALANEKFIFPAVHHAFRFVLLSLHADGKTESLRVLYRLNIQNAVAPNELAALLANLKPATLDLRVADIRRFSPDSLSLMEFKRQREVDVAARIYYGHPLLGEEMLPGAWNVRFTSEFHMTNDSKLFRDRAWLEDHGCVEQAAQTWRGTDDEQYLPLYEGKMVHQYDAYFARPKFWIPVSDIERKLGNSALTEQFGYRYKNYSGAFRAISNMTNERSLLVAALPRNITANHNTTIFGAQDENLDDLLIVLSVLNSFPLDYIERLRVSVYHMFDVVYKLPVERGQSSPTHRKNIITRAARLTCTTPEFAGLWDEVAASYPEAMPAPWCAGHAATDPAARAQLRAEIDALVADLYGLSEEDFAYILSTFPLLDRGQPALVGDVDEKGAPRSYITRDTALLELFKLRGKAPPADIVAFFATAGADIARLTGPTRGLAERVAAALALGAAGYVPGGRAGKQEDTEEEDDNE